MNESKVTVVGAGLAGSEAAWQLARRGILVRLVEMRPVKMTEAHRTSDFAELVCSNSLRNDSMDTAVGVLKEEMRRLGSLVIASADRARVPAGSALAVDRNDFSRAITAALENDPMVEIARAEACEIPAGLTILATGPLTSPALGESLNKLIGPRNLYFYDAIAPIVAADSVDMSVAFMASRYGKGGDDYINCPMTEAQYEAFVAAVVESEKIELHPFEKPVYFEGCMPIEEMARRGPMTLAFGPMRPVGLSEPRSGRRPFAVVQLRQDDAEGRMYNMVGFQTKMTYPEQRRVLRMIPGLEQAEFVRLGSIHRNTFVDSPRLLRPDAPTQNARRLVSRRPDGRGRRLRRVRRRRIARGDQRGEPRDESRTGRAAAGDRGRLAGRLYHRFHAARFPADERKLRLDARLEDPRARP